MKFSACMHNIKLSKKGEDIAQYFVNIASSKLITHIVVLPSITETI